ncbi:MAG TPA: hypothetical protein VNW92_20685, partial [Polyangiaceae bacterium]|nr:hypothetical protein [Polyangiaceae bacterium]
MGLAITVAASDEDGGALVADSFFDGPVEFVVARSVSAGEAVAICVPEHIRSTAALAIHGALGFGGRLVWVLTCAARRIPRPSVRGNAALTLTGQKRRREADESE